ncbi:hypothetical protein [Bacteroides caccae]|uniref:hypothetical protein n=1 Tax=Bacteroides caccae TaxID=47678 RepID=UPI00129C8F84|nr:hypothetical protein [Bacteroides caccae]MEE0760703.1 hypothetical protein [Bacteroides caccae]
MCRNTVFTPFSPAVITAYYKSVSRTFLTVCVQSSIRASFLSSILSFGQSVIK